MEYRGPEYKIIRADPPQEYKELSHVALTSVFGDAQQEGTEASYLNQLTHDDPSALLTDSTYTEWDHLIRHLGLMTYALNTRAIAQEQLIDNLNTELKRVLPKSLLLRQQAVDNQKMMSETRSQATASILHSPSRINHNQSDENFIAEEIVPQILHTVKELQLPSDMQAKHTEELIRRYEERKGMNRQ